MIAGFKSGNRIRKTLQNRYIRPWSLIHPVKLVYSQKLNENINGDNIRSTHEDNIPRETVDPPKRIHNLIYRHLHRNSRKERCKQKQITDQSISLKFKSAQHICKHGTCHNWTKKDKYQDNKWVSKCCCHIGLLPCLNKILKIRPALRKLHHIGWNILFRCFKCCDHTGYKRKHCYENCQKQCRIFKNRPDYFLSFATDISAHLLFKFTDSSFCSFFASFSFSYRTDGFLLTLSEEIFKCSFLYECHKQDDNKVQPPLPMPILPSGLHVPAYP